MTTQAERLVSVEVEVRELKKAFEEHKAETKDNFSEINNKLDDLLALRNKGAGVFWVASGLLGTGIITMFWQFVQWLRG